jgi:F-type H+-transporting ATPase subunit epsilon
MHLKVLSPDELIYEGKVVLVQFPGTMGSFEVLNNHAPLIASVEKGKVKIIDEERNKFFIDIKPGIVEINNNNIVLLTE